METRIIDDARWNAGTGTVDFSVDVRHGRISCRVCCRISKEDLPSGASDQSKPLKRFLTHTKAIYAAVARKLEVRKSQLRNGMGIRILRDDI